MTRRHLEWTRRNFW